SREETGEKGIFNVQLQEKIKDAFELIPWNINLKGMFEGKATSYKDVTMKQWNESYPIFHIKDMTKADSCN
ncbi:hypothetical protein, partial [Candidatus Marithrix sp. Canyon 246]|uniref:hypothetical protein n=1 Tax=Candidatus Marithrix sp. Canyon 246 TaxID=1827136 RepID=UPI0014958AB4